MNPQNVIYISVFLLSASSIAFEILIARVFAISQWNHLSFMVISMALFGFAVAGTILSLSNPLSRPQQSSGVSNRCISLFVLLYSLSAIVSFLILNHMPLDYLKLPLEPIQGLYLMTAYLLLAFPFFHAGMVISSAYMFLPEKTGYIYFFSMAGSAAGALIPLTLLSLTDEGGLIVLTAVLPLAALVPYREKKGNRRKIPVYLYSGILLTLAAVLMLTLKPELLRVSPSQYKSLSQLLLFPEVTAKREHSSLRGRVDMVQNSPFIRFAPGLSLKYEGRLPTQSAVFNDGDNRLVLYSSPVSPPFPYQRQTLSYAGYLLPEDLEHILVIQNGGGTALACALSTGCADIRILEKHPRFAQIVKHHYRLPVSHEDPHRFLNMCRNRFDIIHVENWGASLPGASALTFDHTLTVDALETYFSRLTQSGAVIISRRLLLPPSNMLRLCSSACEALTSLKIRQPERHLAVIRNWDTFCLIISKRPIPDPKALYAYAQTRNFDIVWPQNEASPTLNRFNKFEKPFHYHEIVRLFDAYRSGTQALFFDRYPLDIHPQTDDRPFPDKFFKWRRAATIHAMSGSRLYTLLLSGEFVVLVVFAEALLISLGLLCLPWLAPKSRVARIGFNRAVYFLGVGAGFILTEIYYIHQLTRVFGDPVVSLAVVLASILIFSGTGGLLSNRLQPRHVKPLTLFLGVFLLLTSITANPMLDRLLQLSSPYRQLLSIVTLLPAGMLIGIPFPLGMRFLLKIPSQRAYAWVVNGCASVLASVAATQIAISSGIKSILWGAVAAYGLAWLASGFQHR